MSIVGVQWCVKKLWYIRLNLLLRWSCTTDWRTPLTNYKIWNQALTTWIFNWDKKVTINFSKTKELRHINTVRFKMTSCHTKSCKRLLTRVTQKVVKDVWQVTLMASSMTFTSMVIPNYTCHRMISYTTTIIIVVMTIQYFDFNRHLHSKQIKVPMP